MTASGAKQQGAPPARTVGPPGDELAELAAAQRAWEEAKQAKAAASQRRNEAVRAALAAGFTNTVIKGITGVSHQRIFQINRGD